MHRLPLLVLACLAALSAADGPTWGSEQEERLGSTRSRIVLNGLWRFQPGAEADASAWGMIRVPGAWWGRSQTYRFELPGIVEIGAGPAWVGLGRDNGAGGDGAWERVDAAWYSRPLTVPPAWRGSAIILELTRVSLSASVMVDGREAGRVTWPGGEIDLTGLVEPGRSSDLRVRVDAADAGRNVAVLMGTAEGQNSTRTVVTETRGIIGDVILHRRPAAARISDVFMKPSVRRGEIAVQTELTSAAAGEAELAVEMLTADGRVERRFAARIQLRGDPVQTIQTAWPWPDARRWDLDRPEMYTAMVSVRGAGIDDQWAQPFGFREFWIEGRRFLLNGTEIAFRPGVVVNTADRDLGTIEQIDARIAGLRRLGFNCQEFWPYDNLLPGSPAWHELYYDRADRAGWPVFGALAGIGDLVGLWRGDGPWRRDPSLRAAWKAQVERQLRRVRNHPSVLMWVHTANCFGAWYDQDPSVVGDGRALAARADEALAARQEPAFESNAIVRAIDPTRPVFNHMSGAASDVHATNTYLSMIPWQEQEEWLSRWVVAGDRPFMAVEFGPFPPCDFRRGRNGGGWAPGQDGANYSESLTTEHLAAAYGPLAYALETAEDRAWHAQHFRGGQRYEGTPPSEGSPLAMRWYADGLRRTMRAWRTVAPGGGMVPWDFQELWRRRPEGDRAVRLPAFAPGRLGLWFPSLPARELDWLGPSLDTRLEPAVILPQIQAERLAWICDPPRTGDPAAVLGKGHAFRSGGTLNKAVAVLNDARVEQPFSGRWSLSADGRSLGDGTFSGRVGPAGRVFAPISARLPAVQASTDAVLAITVTIGGATSTDALALRVLPALKPLDAEVALADPGGISRPLLADLGLRIVDWDGRPSRRLLVVGRQALSTGGVAAAAVQNHLAAGGRALILSQDPAWLADQAGFRIGRMIMRQAFPVSGEHPMLGGLDAEDLRDWHGSSTLIEAWPAIGRSALGPFGYPRHGWRWGGRGGVCSAPIEVPHRGSFRPAIVCDFDLAYAAVLEQQVGSGTAVWCTLDLEDHRADPAALQVASRLLAWCAGLPSRTPTAVSYLGGAQGRALLSRLGVEPEAERAGLVVAGGDADDGAVEAAATAGATVLLLPRRTPDGPAGLRCVRRTADGAAETPAWPECIGIAPGGLRWRAPREAWLVAGSEGWEVAAGGQLARRSLGRGRIIACQIDPDAVAADAQTFLRLTRWRQERALSQLLTNLGARPQGGAELCRPVQGERLDLAGPWQSRLLLRLPAARTASEAHADPGPADGLPAAAAATDGWTTVEAPGSSCGGADWEEIDGTGLYRRTITLPDAWVGRDLELHLGAIDDFDSVWWDGSRIGSTGLDTAQWWTARRVYRIPGRLARAGRATVVVRVFDRFGGGGLRGPADDMWLAPRRDADRAQLLYHPDYRDDFLLGDDPHRYCRW